MSSTSIIDDGSDEMEAARIDMDAARHDVLESEKEIQEIKNLLRQVTTSTDKGNRNTLAFSAIKVRSVPHHYSTKMNVYILLTHILFCRSLLLNQFLAWLSASLYAKVSGYYQSENYSETDIPLLKLQLSSPIEELVLTKLYDPLASSDNQEETTESRVVFYDVDTSSRFNYFFP